MKKLIFSILLVVILVSCSAAPTAIPTAVFPTMTSSETPASVAVMTETPVPATATLTSTPARPTATPTVTATLPYPAAGYGPANFPVNVNPLSGKVVANPDLLNRRPVIVKVENLPREHRPQWGLSLADIVYEYYTEMGSSRFAAVYYGSDSPVVGPIRSARFFDFNVVRMYKSSFVFGSAYADLYAALVKSEFSSRMIVEGERWAGIFTRFEPNGPNILQANTSQVAALLTKNKIDNARQNLDGMLFQQAAPSKGAQDGKQIFARFSGGIYNRWDYDTATGKYLRFAETADDVNRTNEKYAQLTDRQTSQPIAADNVVVVEVKYTQIKPKPGEVWDMQLLGEGKAWLARDGKMYPVKWRRTKATDVLTLLNADNTPIAFKPGQTWFEVMGLSTSLTTKDGLWKFIHAMP